MRHQRARLLSALALVIVAAAPVAHAQEERLFQNSWFWGVHAGGTSIGTPARSSGTAGTIGADWLITRSSGGLYVAYDHANFTRSSVIADPGFQNGTRPVTISDMHTASIAGVAFPFHAGGFRPYAGLGFAVSVIGDATVQRDSTNAAISSDLAQRAEDGRSRTTVFALGGAQWQVHRTALFGQVTVMPSRSEFLVTKTVTSITAGVRYNFGSSIEQ